MLPIDRTSKSALDANLVNGLTSDAPVIKASNDVVYNTMDEIYNYVLNLINAGSLTTYPPGQYNKLINGNLDVWQRGTAQIMSASSAYFPDRVSVANFALNASAIKIDQGSSTPPLGSKYYLRYRLSTASATIVSVSRLFRYKMESADVQKLIGNQVTVSFKMRSSVSRNFLYSINVYGFTGADNGVNGTGLIVGDGDYSQNTVVLAANTWTTVSKTFSMQDPATGTGLATNGVSIELWARYTTLGAETDTEYQFSQIQLAPGSVALPFQPRSFAEELALCQRYYERIDSANLNGRAILGTAAVSTTTQLLLPIQFKTEKRVNPTLTQGGSFRLLPSGLPVTLSYSDGNKTGSCLACTGSGFTVGQANMVENQDTGGWIAFDSEL